MNLNFIDTRNKRLRISLIDENNLQIAIPSGISREKALEFIRSKSDWIEKQRQRFRKDREFTSNIIQTGEWKSIQQIKKELIDRTEELAAIHGFKFNRIAVRNQKSRWGSCSRKNNINLNLNLILLPDELRDYVILHELLHTRIKDHSRDFWQQLEKILPDVKSVKAALKRININFLREQL